MVTFEAVMEIHILHKQGRSIRTIASHLGVSRNTAREYLKNQKAEPVCSPRPKASSLLDPHRDCIRKRLAEAPPYRLSATVIYREIRERGQPVKRIDHLQHYAEKGWQGNILQHAKAS